MIVTRGGMLMALQILRIRTSLVRLEDVGILGDDDNDATDNNDDAGDAAAPNNEDFGDFGG